MKNGVKSVSILILELDLRMDIGELISAISSSSF
jgi:hypothetical protein